MNKKTISKASKEDIKTPFEQSALYLEAVAVAKKEIIFRGLAIIAVLMLCYFIWDKVIMLTQSGLRATIITEDGLLSMASIYTIALLFGGSISIAFILSFFDTAHVYYKKASKYYKNKDATDHIADFDWMLGENFKYNEEISGNFLRGIEEKGYLSLEQYHYWVNTKEHLMGGINRRKRKETTHKYLVEKFPRLIGK